MPGTEWIEHRRGDGELLGWLLPEGDGFQVVDLLGRTRTDVPLDWFEAEDLLEALGMGYLADRYVLRMPGGEERRVRIGDVSTEAIVVVADDFGGASAIGAQPERLTLSFPAPGELTWIG